MSPPVHCPSPRARRRRRQAARSRSAEKGVVLLITLIFSLLLLLPATTAMRTVLQAERKSGDLRKESLSFLTAEATIAAAEFYLGSVSGIANSAARPGDYGLSDTALLGGVDTGSPGGWRSFDWATRANAVTVNVEGVDRAAYYVVEVLPIPAATPPITQAYRVTAFARGAGDEASTLLQTTFRR